jgi:hypothetical protein
MFRRQVFWRSLDILRLRGYVLWTSREAAMNIGNLPAIAVAPVALLFCKTGLQGNPAPKTRKTPSQRSAQPQEQVRQHFVKAKPGTLSEKEKPKDEESRNQTPASYEQAEKLFIAAEQDEPKSQFAVAGSYNAMLGRVNASIWNLIAWANPRANSNTGNQALERIRTLAPKSRSRKQTADRNKSLVGSRLMWCRELSSSMAKASARPG